jgi:hypothetical protein
MRLIRLSATLTLLIAGASCAQPSAPGSSEPPPEVTSSALPERPSLGPSGIPSAMRPNVAQPDKRVTDLKPVRWSRVTPIAGRQIEVHYTITGRGDCAALGRVDVVETATDVTVTVLVGRLPGADCSGPQPQLAASIMTVVTLAKPLGSRKATDGAAG